MKIGLISCSKSKNNGKLRAKDKYNSPLFNKTYKIADYNCDKIFILSTKYGLLDPDTVIDDYDETLNDYNKQEKVRWSRKLVKQLQYFIREEDIIEIYAGKNYYQYLIPLLDNEVKLPLDGLMIGERLQYLNRKIKEHEL